MSDKSIKLWAKDLVKALNKTLSDMAEKQAIFNEAVYDLLDDEQKEKLMEELDKQKGAKDKHAEDIQKMVKKLKGEGG